MPETPPWIQSAHKVAQAVGERNLFALATRLDQLEAAWSRVRANAGCAGSDGVTVERFAARDAQRLLGLSKTLRDGSYRPKALRLFDVPKPDGKHRRLAVPAVVDRVAQTAVATVLTTLIDPLLADESFAYRPGRSVRQAVMMIRRHREDGFTFVVEGDIERYFDQVPHAALLDKVETIVRGLPGSSELIDLLALWLESAGIDLDTPGMGIPQGGK